MTLRPSFAPRAVTAAGAPFFLFLALTLATSGCKHGYSSEGTTPEGTSPASELLAPQPYDLSVGNQGGRLFYPFAVGNRWEYQVRFQNTIVTSSGPQPPETIDYPWVVEITGTQHVGAHDYFQQMESDPSEVPPVARSPFLERQTRSGLFELDPVSAPALIAREAAPVEPLPSDVVTYVNRTIQDPVLRAAFQRAAAVVAEKVDAILLGSGQTPRRPGGGAEPGEITFLSYPLFPGAQWIVRDSPRFERTVVAHEVTSVPLGTFPAWKLLGTSELFGPEDVVHYWYSPLGLLRFRYHVVGDATDPFGNPIGRVVSDFDQSLTDIHLVTSGPVLVAGNDARE